MDIKKEVDLDQPFTADVSAEAPVEAQTKEEKVEAPKVEAEEEKRIPYSRFENVSRARREAEAEAEKWRQRAIELEQTRQPVRESNEVPSWWTKLYGEEDRVKEAYSIWQKGQQEIVANAKEEAVKAVREEQSKSQAAYRDNLKALDEHLETISDIAGRTLTEAEQSSVLDIIDEYTAKDAEGNYLGGILPADKAWELYELKQKLAQAPAKKSRDNVANVISTPTSGQPTLEQQERDKNWRPWDASRFPQN